jgi:hypothetical protein
MSFVPECIGLKVLQPTKCGTNYSSRSIPAFTESGRKKRRLRKYVCDKCKQGFSPSLLSNAVDSIDDLDLKESEDALKTELDTKLRKDYRKEYVSDAEAMKYALDLKAAADMEDLANRRAYEDLSMRLGRFTGGRSKKSKKSKRSKRLTRG